MREVNISEAKLSLSRLVRAIEHGEEAAITITRNGQPVARLVRIHAMPTSHRIGVAKGLFEVPDSIDTCNEEIVQLFSGANERTKHSA